MYIDNQKFESYSKEILLYTDELLKTPEKFRNYYSTRINKANTDNIISCINDFVSSEINIETNSKRGIGRATEYYPRFGGYFYNSLKKISKEDISQIGSMVALLIAKTYQMLLITSAEYESSNLQKDELYKKWIISIYLNNFNTDLVRLPENIRDIILGSIQEDYEKLTIELSEKRIKPSFFSKDKTRDILMSYVNAGLILCTIDMQK